MKDQSNLCPYEWLLEGPREAVRARGLGPFLSVPLSTMPLLSWLVHSFTVSFPLSMVLSPLVIATSSLSKIKVFSFASTEDERSDKDQPPSLRRKPPPSSPPLSGEALLLLSPSPSPPPPCSEEMSTLWRSPLLPPLLLLNPKAKRVIWRLLVAIRLPAAAHDEAVAVALDKRAT